MISSLLIISLTFRNSAIVETSVICSIWECENERTNF